MQVVLEGLLEVSMAGYESQDAFRAPFLLMMAWLWMLRWAIKIKCR
ncbi:hypothetical protein [Actinomadura spongiicola]|nr:hypothetical protein [Actinomadura spongiicola]